MKSIMYLKINRLICNSFKLKVQGIFNVASLSGRVAPRLTREFLESQLTLHYVNIPLHRTQNKYLH